MLSRMRPEDPGKRSLDPSRMQRCSSLLRSPFGLLLAALIVPGGLFVLAWLIYRQLARRRHVPVLTSPAPQHGAPAGDARGATAERKH